MPEYPRALIKLMMLCTAIPFYVGPQKILIEELHLAAPQPTIAKPATEAIALSIDTTIRKPAEISNAPPLITVLRPNRSTILSPQSLIIVIAMAKAV